MELDKPQQDYQHCRRARIALRKVDIIFKEEGIEAAAEALAKLRGKLKTTSAIRMWLRDYEKMLAAWRSGLVRDVVTEFYAYGFRRAICVAAVRDTAEMQFRREYYQACQRALEQMAERFRLSISDLEAENLADQVGDLESKPISLNDVNEEELW